MQIVLDSTNPEDKKFIDKLFSTSVETTPESTPEPEPAVQKPKPEPEKKARKTRKKKSEVTLDTINAKVRELAKADRGNIAKVKDILTGFGVERLSELPTDDYPSMMKELEVL